VVASKSPRSADRGGAGGLNPLHCGAVVASGRSWTRPPMRRHVSIPFIAGQWSLHLRIRPQGGRGAKFQSPSLRGSGRFERRAARACADLAGFNPLHCGAVVASIRSAAGDSRIKSFQSPSLRGSGRFLKSPTRDIELPRFNPLHCGAVVASRPVATLRDHDGYVSIPFIAGQWSLRETPASLSRRPPSCFNPLHCGAVVASCPSPLPRLGVTLFQSPSLRGSGRFAPCQSYW